MLNTSQHLLSAHARARSTRERTLEGYLVPIACVVTAIESRLCGLVLSILDDKPDASGARAPGSLCAKSQLDMQGMHGVWAFR